jgi:hypothetical protein
MWLLKVNPRGQGSIRSFDLRGGDRGTLCCPGRSLIMTYPSTALERAFEMANSGHCHGISDIVRRLKAEGHSAQQIEGESLRRQLRALCTKAVKERAAASQASGA